MAVTSRRFLTKIPRLIGRPWNDVARELENWFRKLTDSVTEGIPGGFSSATPTAITPDAAGDAGSESRGWVAADHSHPIATTTAVGLGNASSEGTATSFSRADHVHKRDVRVRLEGVDVGTRNAINFLDSASVNFAVTDDGGNDEVDITATVTGVPTTSPSWTKYTVSHTALQAASTNPDFELFSLPAGGVVHAVKLKHSVAFAGTGITSYLIGVGVAGNLTKYASLFDVMSAVSGTNFQMSSVVGSENHGAATSIRISVIADANTNNSTAGSVDVWVMTSTAA